MIATLRRSALLLVFVALWVEPYLLPSNVFPFLEGPVGAGWYVGFALLVASLILLVWSAIEELPALDRRGTAIPWLPWLLAIVASGAAFGANWAVSPSIRSLWIYSAPLVRPASAAVAIHHIVVAQSAIGVALLSVVVLTSRALHRPIDVSRVPLHRPVSGIALFLFLIPPFVLTAKCAQLVVFILASWTAWVRELPVLEEKRPGQKWRIRLAALACGTAAIFMVMEARASMSPLALSLMHLRSALALAGLGLVFVVVCMSAADGLAWLMRRSKSVRTRMLTLGLACAGLAFAATAMNAPVTVVGMGQPSVSPVFSLVAKLVCLVFMASVFSITLSRGLSKALEQSVRAISEVRRGNLDVALDESGRDEVAAVARSVNRMIAQLREAEFLEKINADLRSRSTQLTQTLEALRTAQTDLVRSERMASVATLVKGIAHELNNPINYIAGNMAPLRRYCEFVTRVATELSDGRARTADELRALTLLAERKDLAFVSDDLARLTADIGEGARRAQLIITDLQSLTSAAQRGVERVDLHRVVRQTISLLQPQVPPGVRLEAELEPVSPLTARAGQIEQVLVNLTDNAVRAVGQRGVVRLYVGESEGQAVVKVTDDGPGMTADVKRQAFEPFFTTRAAGEGSGLGLAIVASIVRAHRGTVTIASDHGKGTQFELRLPLGADLTLEAEHS
jgi:two-component system, NtrC family, sensor kinase